MKTASQDRLCKTVIGPVTTLAQTSVSLRSSRKIFHAVSLSILTASCYHLESAVFPAMWLIVSTFSSVLGVRSRPERPQSATFFTESFPPLKHACSDVGKMHYAFKIIPLMFCSIVLEISNRYVVQLLNLALFRYATENITNYDHTTTEHVVFFLAMRV